MVWSCDVRSYDLLEEVVLPSSNIIDGKLEDARAELSDRYSLSRLIVILRQQ